MSVDEQAVGQAGVELPPEFVEEEQEVFDLPLADLLKSKNWKHRRQGYQTAASKLKEGCQETSDVTEGVIVAAVKDANAAAQEAGVVLAQVYLKTPSAKKEVVEATLAAALEKAVGKRAKTQQLAQELFCLAVQTGLGAEMLRVAGEQLAKSKVGRHKVQIAAAVEDVVSDFGTRPWNSSDDLLGFAAACVKDRDAKKAGRMLCLRLRKEKYGDAVLGLLENKHKCKAADLKEIKDLAEQTPDFAPPTKFVDGAEPAADTKPPSESEQKKMVFESAPEVHILKQLPADFHAQYNDPALKWPARSALVSEQLEPLLQTARLAAGDDYSELVRTLRLGLGHSNNAVIALSAKMLGLLVQGLRTHFACHVKQLLPTLLELLKTKGVVEAAVKALLDSLWESGALSLTDSHAEQLSTAASHKMNHVRIGLLQWGVRCIRTDVQQARLQSAVHRFLHCAVANVGHSDAAVREAAVAVVAAAAGVLGSDAAVQSAVAALPAAQKAKIVKLSGTAAPATAAPAAAPQKPSGGAPPRSGTKRARAETEGAEQPAKHAKGGGGPLPQDIMTLLAKPLWEKRSDGLRLLRSWCEKQFPADGGDADTIVQAMCERLKDSNRNLRTLACEAVTAAVLNWPTPSRLALHGLIQPAFQLLSDQKAPTRAAAQSLVEAFEQQFGPTTIVPHLPKAFLTDSPLARAFLCDVTARILRVPGFKAPAGQLAPVLKTATPFVLDKNPAVRKSAEGLLVVMVSCVGQERVMSQVMDLPQAKQRAIRVVMEKALSEPAAAKQALKRPMVDAAVPDPKRRALQQADAPDLPAPARPIRALSPPPVVEVSRRVRTAQSILASSAKRTDNDAIQAVQTLVNAVHSIDLNASICAALQCACTTLFAGTAADREQLATRMLLFVIAALTRQDAREVLAAASISDALWRVYQVTCDANSGRFGAALLSRYDEVKRMLIATAQPEKCLNALVQVFSNALQDRRRAEVISRDLLHVAATVSPGTDSVACVHLLNDFHSVCASHPSDSIAMETIRGAVRELRKNLGSGFLVVCEKVCGPGTFIPSYVASLVPENKGDAEAAPGGQQTTPAAVPDAAKGSEPAATPHLPVPSPPEVPAGPDDDRVAALASNLRNASTANAACKELLQIVQQHPTFDLQRVLGSFSGTFQEVIKRKLASAAAQSNPAS